MNSDLYSNFTYPDEDEAQRDEECIQFSLWVKAKAEELKISEDYFLMEFI